MPIPFPRRRSSSGSSISYPSSSASSTSSYEEDDEAALIQEEWEESLRQMEVVLSIIVMPFLGKWFGRQWAYWAYDKYQSVGMTRAFFGFK